MDPQWIGTVSTLAGVLVAGGLGLMRDVRAEKRQLARDESQRRHEIDEARFESRRDAYVGFAAACQTAINETDQYDFDHQGELPGDHGHEGPLKRVIGALDLVLIIGPKEAADAALEASSICMPGPSPLGRRGSKRSMRLTSSKVSRGVY